MLRRARNTLLPLSLQLQVTPIISPALISFRYGESTGRTSGQELAAVRVAEPREALRKLGMLCAHAHTMPFPCPSDPCLSDHATATGQAT